MPRTSRQASTAHAFAYSPSYDQEDYDFLGSTPIAYPSPHWNAYHPDIRYPPTEIIPHSSILHHDQSVDSRLEVVGRERNAQSQIGSSSKGSVSSTSPSQACRVSATAPAVKDPMHSLSTSSVALTWRSVDAELQDISAAHPGRLSGILSWLRQHSHEIHLGSQHLENYLLQAVQRVDRRDTWKAYGKVLSGLQERPLPTQKNTASTEAQKGQRLRYLKLYALAKAGDHSKALCRLLSGILGNAAKLGTTSINDIPTLCLAVNEVCKVAIRQDETKYLLRTCAKHFFTIPFFHPREDSLEAEQETKQLIFQMFRRVENPIAWLENLSFREEGSIQAKRLENLRLLSPGLQKRAGTLFLLSLIGSPDRRSDLIELYQWLLHNNVAPTVEAISTLYKWLGSIGDLPTAWETFEAAEGLVLQAEPAERGLALERALTLAIAMHSEQHVHRIRTLQDQPSITGVAMFLDLFHERKQAGQIREAESLARLHLPVVKTVLDAVHIGVKTVDGNHLVRKVLTHLLIGYVNTNDTDGAQRCLKGLSRIGSTPTTSELNTLLKMYAHRSDVVSANLVFRDMRSVGATPDLFTYTTMIALYANCRDVLNANRVFQEMKDAGIEADEICLSSLINAAVEAGDWKSIPPIWTSLTPEQRHNTSIVNVMLKGLVLLSAPYKDVLRAFKSAFPGPDAAGANLRSWTTLLQSACDCDDMDTAEIIFDRISTLASRPGSSIRLSPHLYSILMAGLFRRKDFGGAQAVFESMKRKGFEPTSVIHGMIIKAISEGNWAEVNKTSEEYARAVISSGGQFWQEFSRSRGHPLENLIGPIIVEKAKAANTSAAEAYFNQVVAAGVSPSIHLYTVLLDAFRRAGEVEKLKEVWSRILNLAAPRTGGHPIVTRKNVLAIPLSIYIDGLSTAYQHQEIYRTLQLLTDLGFDFDPHNWNHLVIAMARAGDVERAFNISETVLVARHEEVLDRWLASERPVFDAQTPGDPTTDIDVAVKAVYYDPLITKQAQPLTEPAQRPPNRRHLNRRGGKDDVIYQAQRVPSDKSSHGAESADGSPRSVALKTDVFERWRPADIHWRPFYMTIAVLDKALSELEAGRSVIALVGSDEENPESDETRGPETALSNSSASVGGVSGSQRNGKAPALLLAKIRSRYAKTVGLVMLHRRKARDRAYLEAGRSGKQECMRF